MAQKFDNGASFGTVREILNANADEINANNTAIQNAQKAAEAAASMADAASIMAGKAQSIANTMANSSANTPGRVRSLGNEFLTTKLQPYQLAMSSSGGIFFENGVALPCIRVLENNVTLTTVAQSLETYIGAGVIWRMIGGYIDGWRGTGLSRYDAYAIFAPNQCVAIDMETGATWVYTQWKGQWITVSGDTSGIEAEITALRAAVEVAQATANEAKTAATTLANASTQGVVRTPDTTTPVTPGLLDYNIKFSAGYGATFAPSIPASGSLSDMIGQLKSGKRYGVYKFDGTYTGGWGATGKVTGKGSLLIMPNNTAIAMCSEGDDASIGVFFFLAGAWVDLRAINPLASAGINTVAESH